MHMQTVVGLDFTIKQTRTVYCPSIFIRRNVHQSRDYKIFNVSMFLLASSRNYCCGLLFILERGPLLPENRNQVNCQIN